MDRSNRIKELLLKYVATVTHTSTELERNNEVFFNEWFNEIKDKSILPFYWGFFPIPDDNLGRKIPYALIIGKSKNTIILIHHTDTVDVEDYGSLKDIAYNPEALNKTYLSGSVDLNEDTKKDLEKGGWILGRGATDMKSGGVMHMALFEEYMQDKHFQGSILLLGLPDEENSSAGMRTAAYLLDKLHNEYGLEFRLTINGEPHERKNHDNMMIYDGTIGKLMPIFLVRGKLAHVGQVYSGLNPIHILSEIVTRTELNPDFLEKAGNTVAPPCTWLYFKDRKYVYDVSLPIYLGGYMSILPLRRTPKELMDKLYKISEESFKVVIEKTNESYKKYCQLSGENFESIKYEPRVLYYADLYKEIMNSGNDNTIKQIKKIEKDLTEKVISSNYSRAEACYKMMETLLSFYEYRGPIIILGISAPYYPSNNNMDLKNGNNMKELVKRIQKFGQEKLSIGVDVQNYYTGICDLSYSMFPYSQEVIDYIEDNMIMWGKSYNIPLNLIKKYSTPVLNIGAWGKDFHKYTERVLEEDLVKRSPELIDFTIKEFLRSE